MGSEKTKKFQRLGLYYFFTTVVMVTGTVLLFYFQSEIEAHQRWVNHSYQVKMALERILSSVKDAETGVRGYVITNRTELLKPYDIGRTEVWVHFQEAKRLTLDNPLQQNNLALVETLIKTRLTALENLRLKVERDGKYMPSQGHSVQSVVPLMEQLRQLFDRMEEEEGRLLNERTEALTSINLKFRLLVVAIMVSGLLIAFTAFRQSSAYQSRLAADMEKSEREAWRRKHVAELSRILSGSESAKAVGNSALNYLTSALGYVAGSFYYLNGGQLELAASHGRGSPGAQPPARVPASDNLLGAAFRADAHPKVHDVIPKGYFSFGSSLGVTEPSSLLFLPIHFQGSNIAIMELSKMTAHENETISLLDELAGVIGVAFNAAMARESLQELLEKTQYQAEELQAQQEELRTSNEELEEQSRALEGQQSVLNARNLELESARKELERKTDDLLRTGRYKSDFLAKMSHELRTPLNSLMILSSLLIEDKEKNLTKKQQEFAHSIQSAGNDLLNLINDILDLSKIEAQKLVLHPEDIKVKSFVNQVAATFAPQAENRGLALNVECPGIDDHLAMHSDRQRLEQILRNLISNAIKFTESGHVTLSAELKGRDQISFSVIDTGIGIPKDKLAIIFEAFEQVDSSISRKYSGTGLGLAISRELAQLLGGTVQVESEEGKGAKFTLTVPLHFIPEKGAIATADFRKEVAQPTSTGKPERHSAGAFSDSVLAAARSALENTKLEGKTILIVEDDDRFRPLVANAVRGFDFEPIEAIDGEVALAILEMHSPSAILLDIKLPGISGLGLLEILKRSPQHRHIPIHMISALQQQQSALRIGAMGYLTKPVTVDKIKAAVQRIENLISKKMKSILIVEGDRRQTRAIQNLVDGPDVQVHYAHTGKDALSQVQNQGYDCIILDLSLPDMTGLELLDQFAKLPISLPPIVIYTGRELTSEETERLRSFSGSIILKGAKSPECLLDEVNLFLHRVENLLPAEKREMIRSIRGQEQVFEDKTVLVVDDDLRNIFALTHALEDKGFKVQAAKDGLEALDWLKKGEAVDLVLMDIMMPRMDGYETIRNIRFMERYKNLPIVALTAKAMRGDHERIIEAGANDYLPKPVNLERLFSVLKVWLSSKGIFS